MAAIIARSDSHIYIPRLIPETLTNAYVEKLADRAFQDWQSIKVYTAPESVCFLEVHIFIDGYSQELDDKFELHSTVLRSGR